MEEWEAIQQLVEIWLSRLSTTPSLLSSKTQPPDFLILTTNRYNTPDARYSVYCNNSDSETTSKSRRLAIILYFSVLSYQLFLMNTEHHPSVWLASQHRPLTWNPPRSFGRRPWQLTAFGSSDRLTLTVGETYSDRQTGHWPSRSSTNRRSQKLPGLSISQQLIASVGLSTSCALMCQLFLIDMQLFVSCLALAKYQGLLTCRLFGFESSPERCMHWYAPYSCRNNTSSGNPETLMLWKCESSTILGMRLGISCS